MTKSKFYNSVLEIYKATGQGTPLFVKGGLPNQFVVDELVNEGKLKIITNQYTYLPNDETLCLTEGYCVEEDTSNLVYMRLYMDLDGLTRKNALRDVDFMKAYSEWLSNNISKLKEIDNIEPMIEAEDTLSESDMIFVKTRGWYTKNETVGEVIDIINGSIDNNNEILKLSRQLIDLLRQRNSEEDRKKIIESENEVSEIEEDTLLRRRILYVISQKDKKETIQQCLG